MKIHACIRCIFMIIFDCIWIVLIQNDLPFAQWWIFSIFQQSPTIDNFFIVALGLSKVHYEEMKLAPKGVRFRKKYSFGPWEQNQLNLFQKIKFWNWTLFKFKFRKNFFGQFSRERISFHWKKVFEFLPWMFMSIYGSKSFGAHTHKASIYRRRLWFSTPITFTLRMDRKSCPAVSGQLWQIPRISSLIFICPFWSF